MNQSLSFAPARQAAAVGFAVLYPSLLTWTCTVELSGQPEVRSTYLAGKALQLAFPLFWVLTIERRPIRPVRPNRHGLAVAVAFSLLTAVGMFTLYVTWLRHSALLGTVSATLHEKLGGYGLVTPTRFLGLAVYFATLHTLTEEYYWRWFVFGRMRELISPNTAVVLSGFAFMVHHAIIVHRYLDGAWPAVLLFSLCVAIGGIVWAWLYQTTGSLYGSWLSHMLINSSLACLGYVLLRP